MDSHIKKELPIFDGHNDTFTKLFMPAEGNHHSFINGNTKSHLDLPRAHQAGMMGGIFSIFTPPSPSSPESHPDYALNQIREKGEITYSPIDNGYARDFTNSMLSYIEEMERCSQRLVKIAGKYQDLLDCLDTRKMAVVLLLEGAEAINPDLSNLEEYYCRGVRALGPVWSRPNPFGHGVPFRFPQSPDTGPGLTEKHILMSIHYVNQAAT